MTKDKYYLVTAFRISEDQLKVFTTVFFNGKDSLENTKLEEYKYYGKDSYWGCCVYTENEDVAVLKITEDFKRFVNDLNYDDQRQL